jgi:hypothetical protein
VQDEGSEKAACILIEESKDHSAHQRYENSGRCSGAKEVAGGKNNSGENDR